MRAFLLSLSFLSLSLPAAAQAPQGLGVGIAIGDPVAVLTAKHFLRDDLALAGGVGEGIAVYGDFLLHGWRALPQPSEGRLPAVVGLGFGIDDGVAMFRAPLGVAYHTARHPLEVYGELVPNVRLSGRNDGLHMDGAVGVRWYFSRFN